MSWLFLIMTAVAAPLEIVWFDVGQGDAQLITFPDGKTMLVDSGPTSSGKDVLVPYLQANGVTHLDYVVSSHYHSDHIGALDEVLSVVPATSCFDRGTEDNPVTLAYFQYVKAVRDCRQTVDLRVPLTVGDVLIEFTSSDGAFGNSQIPYASLEENDRSVSFKLTYGDFTYWTGGDLGGGQLGSEDIESKIVSRLGQVDVVKASHHGSNSASNPSFVLGTNPDAVVISCGDKNRYNHPAEPTVSKWELSGATLYQTDDCLFKTPSTLIADKRIRLVSDGITYQITTE